ncbi:MAG: hypothetical protein GEU75_07005 [Dehalococcoidia bacterium]|nr:hypothetical protein [Dehalococcoidia bacterium]
MVWKPQHWLSRTRSFSSFLLRVALVATTALAVLLGGAALAGTSTATAADTGHFMCDWHAEARTQLVSVDPNLIATGVSVDDVFAAFQPWNDLFVKYHGFPIFAAYDGNPQDADILITAEGSPRTWVDTACNPAYARGGNLKAVVNVGAQDAWRNQSMLSHELGHAIGFADHGEADASSPGHIGYKPCANYIGVMSYCTSPQSWFMDRDLPSLYLDGQLVRDYWSR